MARTTAATTAKYNRRICNSLGERGSGFYMNNTVKKGPFEKAFSVEAVSPRMIFPARSDSLNTV
jgi:hypothetical protein